MANYVAWHNKKRTRRLRREDKLLASIRDGESHERQLQLAGDVRLARIRAIRSDRALVVPTSSHASERLQQFDAKITALEEITPEQILEEFVTRELRTAKTPNQSLESTADRRDDQI